MLDTERIVELYQKMKSIGMTDEEMEGVFSGMFLNALIQNISQIVQKKLKEKLKTKMTIVN
jgi:hypothetical protein